MVRKKVTASEGAPVKEIILGVIIAIEGACALLLAIVIPLRKLIDIFEAQEKRVGKPK